MKYCLIKTINIYVSTCYLYAVIIMRLRMYTKWSFESFADIN